MLISNSQVIFVLGVPVNLAYELSAVQPISFDMLLCPPVNNNEVISLTIPPNTKNQSPFALQLVFCPKIEAIRTQRPAFCDRVSA